MQYVPLWLDIIDGPCWKLLDLTPEVFRFYTLCLLAAQKFDFVEGFLPDERTLAAWIHMERDEVVTLRDMAVTCHVLERADDGQYKIHDWEHWRDSKDPTAAIRKRKERARKKALASNITKESRNGHADVTGMSSDVTPQHSAFSIQNEEEDARENASQAPDELLEFGRQAFGERFEMDSINAKIAGWRAAKYSDSWIKDAMLCANCSAEGNISAYINKVLREWRAKGGPDASEIVKAQTYAARQPVEYFIGSPDMLAPPRKLP